MPEGQKTKVGNLTMNEPNLVGKFLNNLLKDYEDERYIFRGINKIYKGVDKISSSSYRWAKDNDIDFNKAGSPFNHKILTDLQHSNCGGITNLIDFSRNLPIALFFSCDGEHQEEPGELIILDSSKIEKKQDITYTDYDSFLMEPANTQTSQKRVTSQRSVFVHALSGYINTDLCEFITVPANLKQHILNHLRKIGIHTKTIYPDKISFVTSKRNFEIASSLFRQGVALQHEYKHKEAIKKYDDAIKLNPIFAEAYLNRGNAKSNLGLLQDAIVDYDKAIEVVPSYADAYNNRGNAKLKLRQNQEAIDDYDKAVKLNPNDADAYYNRGVAKKDLKKYLEAKPDFDKAIELNPNHAGARINRSIVISLSQE